MMAEIGHKSHSPRGNRRSPCLDLGHRNVEDFVDPGEMVKTERKAAETNEQYWRQSRKKDKNWDDLVDLLEIPLESQYDETQLVGHVMHYQKVKMMPALSAVPEALVIPAAEQ